MADASAAVSFSLAKSIGVANNGRMDGTKDQRSLTIALAALFLSGVAGVLNQVIWQRALRIFLGGSETISAMIVVLVFMLGLGLGAGLAAKRVTRLRHPFRVFGLVELCLFAANLTIAFVLKADLSESVYAVQKLALSSGVSLRVVYGVASLLILLVPTMLMGATLPLASEACQRQFGATDRLLIPVLFFLNSVGAIVGAAGGSFYLLPFHGQFVSLATAAGMNCAAGLLVLLAARRVPSVQPVGEERDANAIRRWRSVRLEEGLGLVLGLLSLGFEMVLLRYMMMAHEPLPYTFATVLCSFLTFWSFGVYFAKRFVSRERQVFIVTAILIGCIPILFDIDRAMELPLWAAGLLYFVPCFGFGVLYGLLVSRSAERWGTDVGRFYAFNTVGSCLGILFFTLVGFEIPIHYCTRMIAISVALLTLVQQSTAVPKRIGVAVCMFATFASFVGLGMKNDFTQDDDGRTYWGRDGVVEVRKERGDVVIDGLWHSRLSDGENHIGRYYSWMMAVAGLLAHENAEVTDALVVGNCIGMTATTLAKVEGMQVDTYEINQTIQRVLNDYPDGTLNVATNPNINIMWQDGRSGLALNEKKYDLIITAPLHLRQAGSSALLSREYLQLIKRRLKPGGVVVLYSYEGVPQQHQLIHQTVNNAFSHSATWLNHLLMIASDSPIDFSPETVEERLKRASPVYQEIAQHRAERLKQKLVDFTRIADPPRKTEENSEWLITDDHPLVEYRDAASVLIKSNEGLMRKYRGD